jgi:hypothetical protein
MRLFSFLILVCAFNSAFAQSSLAPRKSIFVAEVQKYDLVSVRSVSPVDGVGTVEVFRAGQKKDFLKHYIFTDNAISKHSYDFGGFEIHSGKYTFIAASNYTRIGTIADPFGRVFKNTYGVYIPRTTKIFLADLKSNEVSIYDFESNRRTCRVKVLAKTDQNYFKAMMRVSLNGSRVAFVDTDSSIKVVNVKDCGVNEFKRQSAWDMRLSDDGKYLVIANSGRLKSYRIDDNQLICDLDGFATSRVNVAGNLAYGQRPHTPGRTGRSDWAVAIVNDFVNCRKAEHALFDHRLGEVAQISETKALLVTGWPPRISERKLFVLDLTDGSVKEWLRMTTISDFAIVPGKRAVVLVRFTDVPNGRQAWLDWYSLDDLAQ